MRTSPFALMAFVAAAGPGVAADWPQFRGPGAAGVSETPVPVTWDKTKNVLWAVDVPGVGWASPVVADGRVYLLTADADGQKKPTGPLATAYPGVKDLAPVAPPSAGKPFGGGRRPDLLMKWQVLCLDAADGKTLWTTTVAEKKPPFATFATNGYASETPVVDGDKVYVYAAAAGLFCLDKYGKVEWSADLGTAAGNVGFGTGSSPALVGDKLFVLHDNEEKSFVAAVDKATGKEVWRADRPGKTAWSSPFVWKTKARTELVCCGDKFVASYDPETGKELWRLGGVDSAFTATPVADAGMIYLGTAGPGSSAPLYAVKAGAAGDISLKEGQTSNEWVAWSRLKSGPGIASAVLSDGYLYVAGSKGALSCYDAKTGEPAYQNERLPKARNATASVWAAGGKVYVLDDTGRTSVVAAGPKFEVVADNPLDEMCWATPAAVDGKLYIRGRDKLYCVAEGK